MFKTVAAVIGLMTATQALDIQSENELAILAEGQSDIASYLMDDDDKKNLVESFKGLKLNQERRNRRTIRAQRRAQRMARRHRRRENRRLNGNRRG